MTDTTAEEGMSPVYTAALETLRKGAPGLSDDTRKVLANTISRKVALFRPAASPPSAVGVGEIMAMSDAEIIQGVIDEGLDPEAEADRVKAAIGCNNPYTPTPAPVDWERVGPKLVEALERIAADGAPYRNGYCQTDIAVDPALTAEEAQKLARQTLEDVRQ